MSAVRDWLTAKQYPSFALGPTEQRQRVSPNRHPHLHAHKSLETDARADNEARHSYNSVCKFAEILSSDGSIQSRSHAYSLYLTSKCPLCCVNVLNYVMFLLPKTETRLIEVSHTEMIDCCALWKWICFKISLFVLNDSRANVGGGHINNLETLVGRQSNGAEWNKWMGLLLKMFKNDKIFTRFILSWLMHENSANWPFSFWICCQIIAQFSFHSSQGQNKIMSTFWH